jgi:hypothetical protein
LLPKARAASTNSLGIVTMVMVFCSAPTSFHTSVFLGAKRKEG